MYGNVRNYIINVYICTEKHSHSAKFFAQAKRMKEKKTLVFLSKLFSYPLLHFVFDARAKKPFPLFIICVRFGSFKCFANQFSLPFMALFNSVSVYKCVCVSVSNLTIVYKI